MRFFILFAFALPLLASPAQAASVGYWNFASCKTTVSKIPFSFDFFEEVDDQTGTPTGKGFAMQTMGDAKIMALKSLGRIEIATDPTGTAKTVKLYAFGNQDVLFSQFTIDAKKPSKVEVFATGFGAVWSTLACEPVVIP